MIVLDTHALIWWSTGDTKRLSPEALDAIREHESLESSLIVSAISAWEIALLVSRSRLVLSMDVEEWLDQVAALPAVHIVAVDSQTSVHAVRLPGDFHAEPADRLIVATARRLNVPLVTGDEKILNYKHVVTIW